MCVICKKINVFLKGQHHHFCVLYFTDVRDVLRNIDIILREKNYIIHFRCVYKIVFIRRVRSRKALKDMSIWTMYRVRAFLALTHELKVSYV